MSFVAKLTIAFAIFATMWFIVVSSFALDDVAVARSIQAGQANLVTEGSSGVNDTTAGTFSTSSITNISFIRRFIITVYDMPWWFGTFVGLFNGFMLVLLTILWIIKVIHGNG